MEKKCPYCNNNMEKGYIQCRDNLYWSKKIRKVAAIPPIDQSIPLAIFLNEDIRSVIAIFLLIMGCMILIIGKHYTRSDYE